MSGPYASFGISKTRATHYQDLLDIALPKGSWDTLSLSFLGFWVIEEA